jgi:ornithine carbamoyltransferase
LKNDLKGRDLVSTDDLSRQEMETIFNLAREFKLSRSMGKHERVLEGKTLGLVFEWASSRTRLGFEVAMSQLGGSSIYMATETTMAAMGEPMKDTSRVLSRLVDAIALRPFKHETVIEFVEHADVPVINCSSSKGHPTQGLGELYTVLERKRKFEGLKLAYVGMTRGLFHELLLACPKVGMNITAAYPDVGGGAYTPDKEIVKRSHEIAEETGSEIVLTHDLLEAVKDADAVYASTLLRSSLTGEKTAEEGKINIAAYQVSSEVLKYAKKDVILMAPGPTYRNVEVTEEAFEGPKSVVWDQVENALYVKKAILALLIA